MNNIEYRLRRYGEAFEREMQEQHTGGPSLSGKENGRHPRLVLAAVLLVILAAAGGVIATRTDHPQRVRTSSRSVPPTGETAWTPCPGSLVETAESGADGLPSADSHTDDKFLVSRAAADASPSIRAQHPMAVSITVGPGGGFVWRRTSEGAIKVEHVTNYAIHVRLPDVSDCPLPPKLFQSFNGVEELFFYRGGGAKTSQNGKQCLRDGAAYVCFSRTKGSYRLSGAHLGAGSTITIEWQGEMTSVAVGPDGRPEGAFGFLGLPPGPVRVDAISNAGRRLAGELSLT